jgi:hypothetical protein
MAVVRYFAVMPSDIAIPGNEGHLLDHSDTFAEFTTMFVNDTKLFIGQDFVYENDALIAGMVTEVAYRSNGLDVVRTTGLEWNVALGPMDLTAGDDVLIGSRVNDSLFAGDGDDSIWGSGGTDYISGELGDDVMHGGKGGDVFIFSPGDGIDKVRDFDVVGAVQDTVLLGLPHKNYQFDIEQVGRKVVIDFGRHDKLILRDIELEDFSKDNIELAW